MRRSREEAAETRRAIVEQASRLFRGKGIDAVSVADIMGALGMTVGGFYRHFESKEALVAEAIDAASLQSTTGKAAGAAEALARYLSQAHVRDAAGGCPVAALCSEVGHQGRATKKAFTVAMERLVGSVERLMPGADRRKVLHTAAAVVGGLMLARASADEKLAAEILQAVREEALK
jgi:TetR/AcrR family transcriptional regulator, transcriptional repressor for nem operon